NDGEYIIFRLHQRFDSHADSIFQKLLAAWIHSFHQSLIGIGSGACWRYWNCHHHPDRLVCIHLFHLTKEVKIMNVLVLLALILLLLLVAIGGKKGVRSFMSFFFSFSIL